MFWKRGYTKEFEEKWEKRRKMNRWRYCFIYGSLLWGLPVAILVIAWIDIHNKGLALADMMQREFIVQSSVQLVLFLLLGMYIGYQDWRNSEKMYQDIQGKKCNSNE